MIIQWLADGTTWIVHEANLHETKKKHHAFLQSLTFQIATTDFQTLLKPGKSILIKKK